MHQIKEALNQAAIIPLEQDIFMSVDKSEIVHRLFETYQINELTDYVSLETIHSTIRKVIS